MKLGLHLCYSSIKTDEEEAKNKEINSYNPLLSSGVYIVSTHKEALWKRNFYVDGDGSAIMAM